VYRVKDGQGGYRVGRYRVSDMAGRVEALAGALEGLGVGRLDRVATLDWNTHWHLEAYFAVPMMGAVLHPVNIRLAPSEIAYVMRQAGDRVVLVNSDFLPLVEKVAPSVPTLRAVVVVDEAGGLPGRAGGLPVYSYEDLVREQGGGYEWPRVEEDQPAAMGYTSGTTGPPKGVYHSHRQIVLHVMSAGLALAATNPGFQVTGADTILHIVPMFHVYSWGLPYLATMLGMKQVYPNKLEPGALLELIDREGVTLTAGVPTVLYMLLSHPRARETRGLKYINGGSALPRGLAEQAAALGIRIIVGYGMTETAPVLTLAIPPAHLGVGEGEWLDYALRTGWPVPLVDLMVVDEEMRPVPRDGRTMGEVVVRAPWVTTEYYMAPDKTEEAWRGGWFHGGSSRRL
jgi:fatty-acyl-CoA synthase